MEDSATTPKSGFNLRSLANSYSDRMALLSKPISKWNVKSPYSIEYTNKNDETLILDIKYLSEKLKQDVLKNNKISCDELIAESTKQAMMLLFSQQSLRVIYSLFVNDSETLIDFSSIDADQLYLAFNHLIKIFEDLSDKLKLRFRLISFYDLDLNKGFANTKFEMESAESKIPAYVSIHLSENLFNEKNADLFKNHYLNHFLIINIAQELIHIISAYTFGLKPKLVEKENRYNEDYDDDDDEIMASSSKDDETTPELEKFKYYTKNHSFKYECGFVWQLHTFGALCFAEFENNHIKSKINRILFDLYKHKHSKANDDDDDFVALPNEEWFANLYIGCESNLMLSRDRLSEILDADETERIKEFRFRAFMEHKRTVICSRTHCNRNFRSKEYLDRIFGIESEINKTF